MGTSGHSTTWQEQAYSSHSEGGITSQICRVAVALGCECAVTYYLKEFERTAAVGLAPCFQFLKLFTNLQAAVPHHNKIQGASGMLDSTVRAAAGCAGLVLENAADAAAHHPHLPADPGAAAAAPQSQVPALRLDQTHTAPASCLTDPLPAQTLQLCQGGARMGPRSPGQRWTRCRGSEELRVQASGRGLTVHEEQQQQHHGVRGLIIGKRMELSHTSTCKCFEMTFEKRWVRRPVMKHISSTMRSAAGQQQDCCHGLAVSPHTGWKRYRKI